MKLLVLGGTVFLGRHVVNIALERGHDVTLFNRGKSNADLFPNLETLVGDRDGGLKALEGRQWDAVVDPSGYIPRLVADSARLLSDVVEHYAFVSSISVYDEFSKAGLTEDGSVGKLEDTAVEEVSGETYGPLKALCEEAASAAMPGRVLNVRAGLIVGPHDPTDRFTYWPVRVDQGGSILAPPSPDAPVQFIDARDLAAWILDMAERRKGGTYNVTGPAERLTMGEFLNNCIAATNSDALLQWTSGDALARHEVSPWVDLPLWLPEEMYGMADVSIANALKDGLTFRPSVDTIRDTLAWAKARPDSYEWKAGLRSERESRVLAEV